MKYTKLIAIAAALMVALFVAIMPMNEAEAAPLSAAGMSTSAPECSLPYVDDVQQVGKKYEALITCAGSAQSFDLKVTLNGKKVKVTKLDTNLWSVKLKKGKTYKVSVRAHGGSWKSVMYGVC